MRGTIAESVPWGILAALAMVSLTALGQAYISDLCGYRWLNHLSPDQRLIYGLRMQLPEQVEQAWARGASPNATDQHSGQTALMIAAEGGDLRTVRSLLIRGARVNVRDDYGLSPLAHAAWSADVRIPRELIAAGAAVNQPNNNGLTPLAHAALRGQEQTVELLLRSDAVVDFADQDGSTPLMLASASAEGDRPLIERLIAAGADPTRTDHTGRSARTYAMEAGRTDLAEVIAKFQVEKCPARDDAVDPGRSAPAADVR